MFRPTSRLKSADLPTFGRPTIATVPALSTHRASVRKSRTSTQLCVRVPAGLQLSYPIHDVDYARDEGKQAGGENDPDEAQKLELQHDPCDCRHLQHRGDFADPARLHMHLAVEQMENDCADQNDRVTRNHEH